MLCGRVILGFYKKMDDKFRSAYGDLQMMLAMFPI